MSLPVVPTFAQCYNCECATAQHPYLQWRHGCKKVTDAVVLLSPTLPPLRTAAVTPAALHFFGELRHILCLMYFFSPTLPPLPGR